MPGRIEIRDENPPGFLAVDLPRVLRLIKREGKLLTWSILTLEAKGTLQNGNSILDLEKTIRDSPQGLILSWDSLSELANSLTEVVWGIFVGCRSTTQIPVSRELSSLYDQCELVIEAVDSSYWSVYAREDSILKRFYQAFRDVRDAEVA